MDVFRNLRSPEGLKASGDAYSSRFGEILVDLICLFRIVDDTIMHDSSIRAAFYHTFDFLITCAKNNVTLNPKKFRFCRKEVDFAGYTLGWDKFYPSNEMLSAIADFPIPNQPSIMGMVRSDKPNITLFRNH